VVQSNKIYRPRATGVEPGAFGAADKNAIRLTSAVSSYWHFFFIVLGGASRLTR